MMIYMIFSVLILLFSSYSFAQQENLVHSLDGYISYALAHNPSVLAARSAVEVSTQDVKLSTALPDPMLMGRAEIDDGLMPVSVGLSQMVMQPVTLALERKSALYKKEAETARLRQTMADVVFRVRYAYFMLYETGQMLKIKQQSLALLKQYEELTRTAYTTGSVAQSSLLKAEIEIARLENDIQSYEQKGISQRAELSAALGISEAVDYPYPESKPSLGMFIDPDSIVSQVCSRFPGLEAMHKEVLSEQAMLKSAKSRYLPDFTLGIEYMRQTTINNNGTSSDSWMWSPSVSLSFPLWLGKKAAAVRKARFSTAKMEWQTQNMQNMVVAEAVMLVNELKDAQRKMKLLENVLIPQAKQMLALMENEYRTGMSRSLDVLDGQRMLLELKMENIMEQTRELNAAAALFRLNGDTGKEMVQ